LTPLLLSLKPPQTLPCDTVARTSTARESCLRLEIPLQLLDNIVLGVKGYAAAAAAAAAATWRHLVVQLLLQHITFSLFNAGG
jgi:hypothetical protein